MRAGRLSESPGRAARRSVRVRGETGGANDAEEANGTATPFTTMTTGPSAPASAAPLSLCYAPRPSTVREEEAQRRVRERSRREEAQQTTRRPPRIRGSSWCEGLSMRITLGGGLLIVGTYCPGRPCIRLFAPAPIPGPFWRERPDEMHSRRTLPDRAARKMRRGTPAMTPPLLAGQAMDALSRPEGWGRSWAAAPPMRLASCPPTSRETPQ